MKPSSRLKRFFVSPFLGTKRFVENDFSGRQRFTVFICPKRFLLAQLPKRFIGDSLFSRKRFDRNNFPRPKALPLGSITEAFRWRQPFQLEALRHQRAAGFGLPPQPGEKHFPFGPGQRCQWPLAPKRFVKDDFSGRRVFQLSSERSASPWFNYRSTSVGTISPGRSAPLLAAGSALLFGHLWEGSASFKNPAGATEALRLERLPQPEAL